VLVRTTPAARVLTDSGVTVAAARHKVGEASARRRPGDPAPTVMTSRAERAMGRAVRFSHQEKAESVGTDHLLLGVLDVEGTAGQVLRGIGVDVAALRAALVAAPDGAPVSAVPAAPAEDRAVVGPRCQHCGASIDDLTFSIVRAHGADARTGDAVVFSCTSCGAVLGVAPPRTPS
jgi:ATP-dependent Clp protease ATP-binding subunit ClpA